MKEALPEDWENIIINGKDDYLRMDYTKTTPLLRSALQYALNKIDKLEKDINKLKKIIKIMILINHQKQKPKQRLKVKVKFKKYF